MRRRFMNEGEQQYRQLRLNHDDSANTQNSVTTPPRPAPVTAR